ncbi:MAG: DUF2845 domain-containing protein [Gammaproteobacteria bacterium]
MRSHCIATVLFVGLIMTAAPAARGDTLRCGSKLVEPGVTADEVLAKCGKPTSLKVISEPVRVRTRAGGTRVVGTAEKEIWRYHRGSGRFPAILTFEEGILKALEFEKS